MIEVHATPRQPLGMPSARFLRDFWQKRPLLIRGMFPHFHNLPSANDLAGLACEEAALSRIVVRDEKRDRWTLRSGPFAESDFAKMPKSHWTLLVQDVDKWDADVATLLDHFRFIPSWRVDDVMVSYATDGGGVGPHVDHYDVFLIQANGQRRWRISVDGAQIARKSPRIPAPASQFAAKAFRDDSELKLLRNFVPTHEWTLVHGDVLYLPPGVPHAGTALGECMTFSVGMRAPAQAELLLDLAEFLAERLGDDLRYTDPDLAPARDPSEIDAATLARLRAAMPQFTHVDKSTLAHWFGCFITRYRSVQIAAVPTRALLAAEVRRRLLRSTLLRNPFSRFAWRRVGRAAELFVAGEAWRCSLAFARLAAAMREIDAKTLAVV
ncbi:MAG: cupin domain-containing protein, partial [Rudaea sp.]